MRALWFVLLSSACAPPAPPTDQACEDERATVLSTEARPFFVANVIEADDPRLAARYPLDQEPTRWLLVRLLDHQQQPFLPYRRGLIILDATLNGAPSCNAAPPAHTEGPPGLLFVEPPVGEARLCIQPKLRSGAYLMVKEMHLGEVCTQLWLTHEQAQERTVKLPQFLVLSDRPAPH